MSAALELALRPEDEAGLGAEWARLSEKVLGYVTRPAKRVRPALLIAGYRASRGEEPVPDAVYRFAAGLEILHAFMLVHDDIADRAETRRGGASLHRLLATSNSADGQRLGQDLALVSGDHLFARAVELMLSSGAPNATEATLQMLAICRHTAAGQALDLALAQAPLASVTLFETMRVAQLKTARYGFVAPLLSGALLAGAPSNTRDALSRAGRHAGIAFQLRDDVLGLFGDDQVAGKSGAADFIEGKRTFPIIAAWTRADAAGRAELEALMDGPKDEAAIARMREALERHGGRLATERVIARCTRAALKALATVPHGPGRATLEQFLSKLANRSA
ncbi:MAG: polyprenyl synthetase family protein [Myxococcaceae bacterium]|nr:polyprenyl synthetase family protein [Myxococcaceae bacterium]